MSIGASVAVVAAELLRPADDEGTLRLLYFTMFVRFFFSSLSLSHRLLSSSHVHHHHHHHHHLDANDGLRALSIYLSTNPLNSQAFCFGPNSSEQTCA